MNRWLLSFMIKVLLLFDQNNYAEKAKLEQALFAFHSSNVSQINQRLYQEKTDIQEEVQGCFLLKNRFQEKDFK